MITVQPANVDEIQQIRQLMRETWIDTYHTFIPVEVIYKITALWHKPETLAAEIENENVCFAVAKDENNATLGLLTAARRSDDIVYIGRLYVLPAHQRQGIGVKLLEACIAAFPGARQLRLDVEAENSERPRLLPQTGFHGARPQTGNHRRHNAHRHRSGTATAKIALTPELSRL